ncbi:MAG TPA: hypothetical protein PK624_04285 [Spirochaetota bacterium]|nr:hypothetical protein [Spirochaetota bacterium]HOR43994.1 hypothetical protein [Spirochaetota bacterium]HPK56284.1 hypothetical protein [Spirochaetota bacterium]
MRVHCPGKNGLFSKILFALTITFLCILSFDLNAGYSGSLIGNQLLTKDEGTLYGGGINIRNDFPKKFGLRNTFITADLFAAANRENKGEHDEITRFYAPLSVGLEYRFQLFRTNFYIVPSLSAGLAYFKIMKPKKFGYFYDYSQTETQTGIAPYAAANASILWIASQKYMFSISAGYESPMFSSKAKGLKGFMFTASIGYNFSGINRGVGYE